MDSLVSTVPSALPSDFLGWERLLTRQLLTVGPSGDASSIRSFEVSPETLGHVVGLPAGRGQEALSAFKAIVCRPSMVAALEGGAAATGMSPTEVPGFFAYLVLTIIVASMPDRDGDRGGDFRRKLREFSGTDRSFNDLHGIAALWRRLVDWLEARRATGQPFRSLTLPAVPKSWPHIGYTLRLAFPARTDATLLSNFLQAQPELLAQPRGFIVHFEAFKGSRRCSEGLTEVFEDFRREFLTGNKMLADHPFWRLARSCAPDADGFSVQDARIECSFEQDGSPTFFVVSVERAEIAAGPTSLSQAVAALEACRGMRFGALSFGFLPFMQESYGRWACMASLEDVAGRVRMGCSSAAYARLRQHRDLFSPSGSWFFSKLPMAIATADECARLLGWSPSAEPSLSAIQVRGGVRTGAQLLGRPRFLPRISAGGDDVVVKAGPRASGSLHAGRDRYAPSVTKLEADCPLEGSWTIEPASPGSWSRQVSFAASAFPHPDCGVAASSYQPLKDWSSPEAAVRQAASPALEWDGGRHAMPDDLVEAVYAGGRSGWDEGDLVLMLQQAYGGEVNPWTVLRLLRDAAIIQPFLRPRWRGRVWTLRSPTLRRLDGMMVVEGATCDRQVRDFRGVCSAFGGAPFRRYADATLSPAVLGSVGGDHQQIAARLGWPIADSGWCGDRRMAFVDTSMALLGRERTDRWDWRARRFVTGGSMADDLVALSRWELPGGSDHDIYVVSRSRPRADWRFLSRGAAVCFAHCISGVPLFDVTDGAVLGHVPEACLPDAVAARLRLGSLLNSGLRQGCQVYTADRRELHWLASILPGLVAVDGVQDCKTDVDAVSKARHSRGRIRLIWKEGSLSVPSASKR